MAYDEIKYQTVFIITSLPYQMCELFINYLTQSKLYIIYILLIKFHINIIKLSEKCYDKKYKF